MTIIAKNKLSAEQCAEIVATAAHRHGFRYRLQGNDVETGPRHPAKFAMRICASTDKLGVYGDNEIPAHPPPDEMECVALAPDVGSAASNGIGLAVSVVFIRTGQMTAPTSL